jgi:hypothetical protein
MSRVETTLYGLDVWGLWFAEIGYADLCGKAEGGGRFNKIADVWFVEGAANGRGEA